MNSLHSHPLHATSPEGLTSYLRGTQRHSHTTVGRSAVLARSPAQRETQTSITASMLFAVFAMLVTAGVLISPAEAANGFNAVTVSTGRDSDTRITHSGRVQPHMAAAGINEIGAHLWDAGGGGPSQGPYVGRLSGNVGAANGGQRIAEIQSNVDVSSFLTSQSQTASVNLLAISLTLQAQIGANL